jgi:GAF domain-containing protein
MVPVDQILSEIERTACGSPEQLMILISKRLGQLPHFDWVGFYMLNQERVLELGAYVGAPTPHTRIPLDRGICGAAASSAETVIVDDVASDSRYLACSLATKSEIVAPIFVDGKVVGELDIDSHSPAAFGPVERDLVEKCAAMVGRALERQRR